MLPGFIEDLPYLRDTTGFESFVLAPIINFEDVASTEQFLMNAWANDPLVPPFGYQFPLPGFYGLTSESDTVYKDTTEVDWDAKYEVVVPVAQMLFDRPDSGPAYLLGCDLHAGTNFGLGIEDIMRCSAANNYTYAREHCGRVSKIDYTDKNSFVFNGRKVVHSNFGVPIMLNHNSSQLVGMVGGHFQWGKSITGLIPDDISGIDIVLRTQGEVLTFFLEKGQAIYQGPGDTHGSRFDEFKYVVSDIVISGSDTFTLEFYLQQDFMDQRTDYAPVCLAVGAALQILLCTLLFMLYDLPMRKDAVRTEIVLETKRRFVRFVSHEIRTPLNTVNMGLTLFGLELDTVRDAVEHMVGPGQEQGQSGAQTSLEVVQKFLLAKIDELKSIARDVTTSTDEAVVVLNDLLNYDKVSPYNNIYSL
ncbi:hypothetical protein B484DRAFT_277321 [Ochromonadaceae sp. CCMP2298]|nr:hypothetical protein B484DRAFT_277321 [Ochromonadaceae sp. CCMP2298]